MRAAGRDAYVVDAVRTPVGRFGGALAGIRPDDLAAHAIRELIRRNPMVNPHEIDDVYWGAANQSGEDNRNVARMAALLAGLPISVAGATVNRLCGSGLEAVNCAHRAIKANEGDVFIAGGSESMTRAPYVLGKPEKPFDRAQQLQDTTLGWRFTNPALDAEYGSHPMGQTAEIVAADKKISRKRQDAFAVESQLRAAKAQANGNFDDEIAPMNELTQDEGVRADTTIEKLSKLKSAFQKDGTITAGNSSTLNDGAACLLLASESYVNEQALPVLGRVITSAVVGVEPCRMSLGPVVAVEKALQRAGLSIKDIDLWELNEAFAAQSLACIDALRLDTDRVNVNGGAIALGHPLGASGAKILTTLLYEMRRRNARYGVATMCIGVGQGIATVVERDSTTSSAVVPESIQLDAPTPRSPLSSAVEPSVTPA